MGLLPLLLPPLLLGGVGGLLDGLLEGLLGGLLGLFKISSISAWFTSSSAMVTFTFKSGHQFDPDQGPLSVKGLESILMITIKYQSSN